LWYVVVLQKGDDKIANKRPAGDGIAHRQEPDRRHNHPKKQLRTKQILTEAQLEKLMSVVMQDEM